MTEIVSRGVLRGGFETRTPKEVSTWGFYRIAAEYGCSRNMMRRRFAVRGWRTVVSDEVGWSSDAVTLGKEAA